MALLIVGSYATALLAIAGLLVLVGRKAKPLFQMADDWRGEPERRGPGGIVVAPARMSVMERLAALETAQAEMRKELRPNGGSSFRDAVDRRNTGLVQQVKALHETVQRLADQQQQPPKIEAGEIAG